MKRLGVSAVLLVSAILAGCASAPTAGPGAMTRADALALTSNALRDNLPPSQPYGYAVQPLDRATAERLSGWIWKPECPVRWEDLSIVTATYHGFDGLSHTGRILTLYSSANQLVIALSILYNSGFPIYQMDFMNTLATTQYPDLPVNNSYSFHCRAMTGGSSWSEHAYGRAMDINPVQNPYYKQSTGYVFPPDGRPYITRDPLRFGMIGPSSSTELAFNQVGWSWGGRWSSLKDWMHFSVSGR